jgi:hypothetical protein
MRIYVVQVVRAQYPTSTGESYITVCVALFKAEFNFFSPSVHPAFYSSMPGSYTVI